MISSCFTDICTTVVLTGLVTVQCMARELQVVFEALFQCQHGLAYTYRISSNGGLPQIEASLV